VASTWIERSVASCWEKTPLNACDIGLWKLFARMKMSGGAVEAKLRGERPPNGSGYDGFGMMIVNCFRFRHSEKLFNVRMLS
jgi:hypothetical protein